MVVVDGYGLAPVPMTREEARDPTRALSFRTIELRGATTPKRQALAVERLLADQVERYRPTIAVFAVHRKEARDHPRLRLVAREFLARCGIPSVERRILDARCFVLGRVRGSRRDGLPARLASDFFPELQSRLGGSRDRLRYERHAWNALAIALDLLAELHPPSVFALAQPGARFSPTFKTRLTHAAETFRG